MQLLVCLFMSHACRSQLVHLVRKLLNSYVNCACNLHFYHATDIIDIVHACMHIIMYCNVCTLTGYHCAGKSQTVLYICCRDGNKREYKMII